MSNSSERMHLISRHVRFAITLSLILAWFSPVVTASTDGPRLSGIETLPIVVLALHLKLSNVDFKISRTPFWLVFLFFSFCSWILSHTPIVSWLFCCVLLIVPFFVLSAMELLNSNDRLLLRRNFFFLIFIEFLVCIFQIVSDDANIDRVKGTLIGTGSGAHVASFLLIIGSHLFFIKSEFRFSTRIFFVLLALVICILADAKQVLLYYFLVVIFASVLTKAKHILPRYRSLKFLAPLLISTVSLAYLFTGFGGIKGYNYLKLSLESDGGKIAVTKLLVNPDSEFWKNNNFMFGAGPANTVSRSSGMTVPGFEGNSPARKFGLPESKYYAFFLDSAKGRGYVGDSSTTSPSSSLLGVLGDFGLLGLVFYLFSINAFVNQRRCMYKPHIAWKNAFIYVFILGLGLIGEWPEFTVATLSLCTFLGLSYNNDERKL